MPRLKYEDDAELKAAVVPGDINATVQAWMPIVFRRMREQAELAALINKAHQRSTEDGA